MQDGSKGLNLIVVSRWMNAIGEQCCRSFSIHVNPEQCFCEGKMADAGWIDGDGPATAFKGNSVIFICCEMNWWF